MHEVLVNRIGGLSLPRKSVVRLTDRPDMTLDVYRGRKTTIQQQQDAPINTSMPIFTIHNIQHFVTICEKSLLEIFILREQNHFITKAND